MDINQPQSMDYSEREALKRFAARCGANNDVQSLERALIMIAHWMRQGQRISFTEYASQWTEAQKDRENGNHSTEAMAKTWPFGGKRCISKAGSDYYPAGVGDELCDDETEIKHAVTVLLAEYPHFNCDGLELHNSGSVWVHPSENASFMIDAKSCLAWIRKHGLCDKGIKTFPDSNPTSYGFKHHVEAYNKKHCENCEHPHYIRNGAFIAAMVACGYRFERVGKMNASFNISKKAVQKALSEQ